VMRRNRSMALPGVPGGRVAQRGLAGLPFPLGMSLFDRFFGKGRVAAAARAAELRGDLIRSAELFGEAGQAEEAARITLIRAEGESEARARLQLLALAARIAPEGTVTNRTARLRRAELLLALAGDTTISAVARQEMSEAAQNLEQMGEPLKAADAYARAGDKEGQARALQAAGDVDRLEYLLSTEQHEDRISRAREDRARDVDLMVECGRRREALAALVDLLASAPDDAPLRQREAVLRARRVSAPLVTLELTGERWVLVLGDEIVVGRSEGAIKVPSNAVSRQHLRIYRDGDEIVVKDLESRNGTQLRGVNLAGALPVKDGLDLKLGREVPLRIAPSSRLSGAVDIELGGERYVAALGRTELPGLGLELTAGSDGWVELLSRTGRAYAGDVEMVPRATLLVGDALGSRRGAEPAIRVLAR
jgi:hypothetical protein